MHDLSSLAFEEMVKIYNLTKLLFTYHLGFLPAYGLAEATLVVSASYQNLSVIHISRTALAKRMVEVKAHSSEDTLTLVGCGSVGSDVRIVDSKTMAQCNDITIGEIWISSDSVALRYWDLPEESERVFCGRILGFTDSCSYLRTGDLGFFYSGQLFITGRMKDVLILRGQNYFPEDIEWLISSCNPELRPGCGAVFSFDWEDEERVGIVWEIRSTNTRNHVAQDISKSTMFSFR